MNTRWLVLLALVTIAPIRSWDYSLAPPEASYAIGTKENPHGRLEYEQRLLSDPRSGVVPANIRFLELQFEQNLVASGRYRAAEASRKTAETWQLAGPFNVGGRTRGVALDVTDENTIIAGGVSGGVWKSTNSGTSWRRVSDPENFNSVTSLAQDKRSGKTSNWYFGTGELLGNSPRAFDAPYRGNGLFRSTDGGESWIEIASTTNSTPERFGNQFQYTWNVLVNHQNLTEDELWVAAFGGILKSSDGGDTWESVLTPPLFDLPDTADLNITTSAFFTNILQSDEGHFYASISSYSQNGELVPEGGFYFSEDGSDWVMITPGSLPGYHERTVMAFAPSDNRIVYFFTRGNDESALYLHRYRLTSVSAGIPTGSWEDLSGNLPEGGSGLANLDTQGGYNMMLSIHPADPETVFLGGTNLYRSENGFSSRSETKRIGGYDPDNSAAVYPNHHPDQHFALFYPGNPNKMLSANDGGLRLTQNATADSVMWTSLNNGFVTSQFYTIAQQQNESTNLIIGGMQDNGTYLRSAPGENPSWSRILGGDGSYSAISADQAFVYVSFQYSQIYRLTLNSGNQLTSFARVDPAGVGDLDDNGEETYLFSNPFVLDPSNNNRMFLIGVNELWRNENLAQIPGASQQKTTVNWTEIEDARYDRKPYILFPYSHLLWNNVDDTAPGQGIYTALHKHFSEDVVYAGVYMGPTASAQIVRVENASIPDQEDVTKFNPMNTFPDGAYPICVRSNPENVDEVVVVLSNYRIPSIFHSADGGATYIDISGNLEAAPDGSGNGPSVRWMEVVPTTTGVRYFAGTSVGLFSTNDLQGSSTLWIKESEDRIGKSVVVMMDYRPIDGRLVVATHGNGVLEAYVIDYKSIESPTKASQLSLIAYPNPFTEKSYLSYTLPANGVVRIDVVDASGKLIKNLLHGPQFTGTNTAIWDGTTISGVPVASGIYYCTLTFGGKTKTRRVLYLP